MSQVDWDAPCPLWLAIIATAAGLLVGYLIKHQCVINAWANEFQYRRLCYSDIQALWVVRGIRDGLVPYRDVQMEYPVLTGMFMDLSGRLLRVLSRAGLAGAPSHSSYFVLSSVLLAPFGFLTTAFIRPFISARRLMVWAAGPPILLYGFMNWDLPAVAAAAWALAAFLRKRYGWAGVAAAVGASAKLYPAFLVPALALAVLSGRQRGAALRLIAGFGLTYAAINVPWMILSNGPPSAPPGVSAEVALRPAGTNGWLGVWLFHTRRGAEFDTIWFWLGERGGIFSFVSRPPFVSLGTLALFAVSASMLLWSGWRRRGAPGGFPVIPVCLGILCSFLLTSKIYSPQYGLWLAPLLALAAVPWPQVAAFIAADIGVFVSRFYFYTVDVDVSSGWAASFEASVWLRALALAAMMWWSFVRLSAEPGEGHIIVSRPD